jgi:epsilon-lactone hydrolase
MFLLDKHLRNALDAYADPADQKHPWVSSVYGDYGKGYPPTLIQAGTKELVLSSSVRLYQAMDTAGVEVTLDIYEGMPHVFQAIPGMPEAEKALQKVKAFLDKYMGS